jgi:hypothetical protein
MKLINALRRFLGLDYVSSNEGEDLSHLINDEEVMSASAEELYEAVKNLPTFEGCPDCLFVNDPLEPIEKEYKLNPNYPQEDLYIPVKNSESEVTAELLAKLNSNISALTGYPLDSITSENQGVKVKGVEVVSEEITPSTTESLMEVSRVLTSSQRPNQNNRVYTIDFGAVPAEKVDEAIATVNEMTRRGEEPKVIEEQVNKHKDTPVEPVVKPKKKRNYKKKPKGEVKKNDSNGTVSTEKVVKYGSANMKED